MKPLVFSLLASLFVANANALSLSDAYLAAVKNDAQLRATVAQTEAARESLPQASARLLPTVGVTGSRFEIHQERTDNGVSARPQDYPSYSVTLSLRQPIYSPRLWAAKDQAKASVAGSEAGLDSERQSLANRLALAYANVALAYERDRLITTQERSAESRLMAANKAFQAGVGIRTDIDEVQAQLDLLRAQRLQAGQAIQIAHEELRQITGIRFQGRILIDPNFPKANLTNQDLESWLMRVRAENPEIRSRASQVIAAQAAARAVSADHLPTLELVAQLSRSSSENNFFVNSKTSTEAVGFQISVPIYQGGFLRSRDRQARAEVTASEEVLERVRLSVEIAASKQFYGLKEGLSRVQALQTAVASGEQVVLANQKSFLAGLRSMLDILSAEQRLAQVHLELSQARLQVFLAWVQLNALVGSANEDIFRQVSEWFVLNQN